MTREEIDLYAHICKELGCFKIKTINLQKDNEELKGKINLIRNVGINNEQKLHKRIEELEKENIILEEQIKIVLGQHKGE